MEDLTPLKRGGNVMRRQLFFDYAPDENQYLIQEEDKIGRASCRERV